MIIEAPVLFIIFNRPAHTQKTFEALRAAKPLKLYVAADGSRPHIAGETEKCEQTRKIIDSVDWDCEVKTLYRNTNVGVEIAVLSAINWFFEQEEMGIIFEDDCVPSPSFFIYAQILLNKYKSDERILFISGSNFVKVSDKIQASYYFSKFGSGWGWATWRRAWKEYKVNLIEEITDEEFKNTIRNVTFSDYDYNYFTWLLNYHRIGKEKNWDWRLTFYAWHNEKFIINPNINLISNIGYGEQATSSTGANKNRNKLAALPTYEINKFIFNDNIKIIPEIEKRIQNIYNPPLSFIQKVKNRIPASIKNKIKAVLKNLPI